MCAIFGIARRREAAKITYLGLHALQHRGQEGSGIITRDDTGAPHVHKQLGLVSDIFSSSKLEALPGHASIGHNRYSTAGNDPYSDLQPMFMKSSFGWLAVAHNGNLVNAEEKIRELESQGAIFHSSSDTEVILHLFARARGGDFESAVIQALEPLEGAFSLLILSHDRLIAVRDPRGFRPLIMGDFDGSPVFASETVALDLIGAKFIREVEPGEMITVNLHGDEPIKSRFPWKKRPLSRCIFEHIYFARPDSLLYGTQVHDMRKELGRQLAIEQPTPTGKVVIPVPDSGVPAAIGYSQESKIPFDMGIIRSHYVGRTFIEPTQSIRHLGVKLKLNPVGSAIEGRDVVVVDDSLVRGTTSKKLIEHLRLAGAKSVHLRISAPPTAYSCFYGIDTPTRAELLAANYDTEKICKFIGADSLGYLSIEGLLKVARKTMGDGFCHACFSGEYPTKLDTSRTDTTIKF